MRKIIRNAIRCNHCGDVIESTYRHNYVQCSCGKVAVDGGTDYLRRSYSGNPDDYTDLSETIQIPDQEEEGIAEANHMTQEKIHSFALKWLQKYEDDNTPRRLLEEDFAPDCFDLGFEMDCGNSFEERYSFEAFRNPDAFSKVVASIDDPMFLGAAIFSKWRGITHWWEQDLFETQNKAWFITAFKRLAQITE